MCDDADDNPPGAAMPGTPGDRAGWLYNIADGVGCGRPVDWIKEDGVVERKYLFPPPVAADSC